MCRLTELFHSSVIPTIQKYGAGVRFGFKYTVCLFYIALSSNAYWVTGDYCNYVKNSKYWNTWGLHVIHLHNLLSNLRIVECTEFKHVVCIMLVCWSRSFNWWVSCAHWIKHFVKKEKQNKKQVNTPLVDSIVLDRLSVVWSNFLKCNQSYFLLSNCHMDTEKAELVWSCNTNGSNSRLKKRRQPAF